MNIDDQVALDAMKANRNRLSEDVDRLKKNNEELRDLLIKCRHKSYDIEAEKDMMNNISFLGTSVSFILAMFVGVLCFFFIDDVSGSSKMICIIIGVWFSSFLGYYAVWRLDIKYRWAS